ncbi:MAG: DUF1330 domain-containing protein [Rhodospirillales bacterium]|nr:DUF1330 domain-containing protein [Rhodospirillales bacterium]
MTVYLVGQIQIKDEDTYQQYVDGFFPIFQNFKGEILAVDDNCETVEGDWQGARTVIIKFPDKDELKRWYNSPEYQELVQLRLKSSSGNLIIAEGFEMPAA